MSSKLSIYKKNVIDRTSEDDQVAQQPNQNIIQRRRRQTARKMYVHRDPLREL